jgi:hypothetical protein
MAFPRWLFRLAGIYGLAVLLPQYFLEHQVGVSDPPPVTHPEFYYGFIGVAVAWQFVFLLIGHDPRRYRPLMLVAVLEKASFGIPAIVLFAQRRLAAPMLAAGLIDLTLGVLFLIAFWRTGS